MVLIPLSFGLDDGGDSDKGDSYERQSKYANNDGKALITMKTN